MFPLGLYQQLFCGVIQNWRELLSKITFMFQIMTHVLMLHVFHRARQYFLTRKFANVFGSSRLLGSLALSPPGMRRKDDQTGSSRSNFSKEREVRSDCIDL